MSLKPHQFAEAHALLNQLESFHFHFQLHCWQQILNTSDILPKYLQSSSFDLSIAMILINGFKIQMAELRSDENLVDLKNKAKETLAAFDFADKGQFVPSRTFSTIEEADNHLKVYVFGALHATGGGGSNSIYEGRGDGDVPKPLPF